MSNSNFPSGRSDNMFGSPPVIGQSNSSTSNPFGFGPQIGELKTGGISTDFCGNEFSSKSFFGTTPSAVSRGSAAPFCATSGPFFVSTSPSFRGEQSTTLAFGTTGFGFSYQSNGSRRAAFSATKDEDNKYLQSLSAMPVYRGKIHEELRLEDYNAGDRGGIVNGGSTPEKITFPLSSPWAQICCPLDPKPSFSTFAPQTSSNPFSTQTTSSLFSPQTFPGFFPPQTTSSLRSRQTFPGFSPPQTSPGFFSSQTTSTFPLLSPSAPASSPLAPQPNNCTFSPKTPFPTQTTSNLFSPQNSPGWFPPQTASNGVSNQTFSNSIFPQTTCNSFSPQNSPGWFPPQTASNGISNQTFSNSIPPQASFTFSPQNSFGTLPSFFPRQPSTNHFAISPVDPQTSVHPIQPQRSSNGFPTATTFSPFSNQTSPSVHSPQIPATTFAPTTTSFTFPALSDSVAPKTSPNQFSPKISPSLFAPHPTTSGVSAALPVLNNFRTCTDCPTPVGFNSFPASVDQSNSPPFVSPPLSFSTSNANACDQIPSLSTVRHSAQTVQTTNLHSSAAEVIGPSPSSQGTDRQSTFVGQPVVNPSPVGEYPAMTHLTIKPGSTISVQYGISSMPVHDKPLASVRLSSSLTSGHLSHHQMRLPARKYESKSDCPKVPFFCKDEERPSVRASTLIPRENLRAFVLSAELWPRRSETEETSPVMNVSLHGNDYGISSENNTTEDPNNVLNINLTLYEPDPHESKNSKERMDDIEALLPQLSLPDYFTEPPIKQLAEKEMVEPGFCSRVHDFEIGRYGYGSIKFLGETDVRRLSLDSLVKFDNREVALYKNENEKPPVGKGLNKVAEVTLLNIQCIDKKTGKKYVDGPDVERYKEMLIKRGEEQGVEFISFDPVKGEWKFRVQHF